MDHHALYSQALSYVRESQDTSCPGLQRNLQVGHDTALALRQRLVDAGVVHENGGLVGTASAPAGPAEPYFLPWVGTRYRESKPRLLILGESHYSDEPMPQTATIALTQQYVDGLWSHRFWTILMQVIRGQAHWDIDRAQFWAEHAFYNYVQEVVGDSAGVAPTDAMFAAARQPFQTVLDRLQPERILVLSARLWDRLAADGQPGPTLAFGNQTRDTLVYRHSGGTALASWIPHPSRISWQEWRQLPPALLGMDITL